MKEHNCIVSKQWNGTQQEKKKHEKVFKLVISEIQIRTSKIPLHTNRMATSKKTDKYEKHLELSHIADESVKWYDHFREQFGDFFES